MPLLIRLVALLPMWFFYLLSELLILGLRISNYRGKVISENLKNSFPESTRSWRKKTKLKFYRNFCDLIVETIKISGLKKSTLAKRVLLKNPEILEELYKEGKGAVIVQAHYCNWEWATLGLDIAAPHATLGVYKPLSNPKMDLWMKQMRGRLGLILVEMKKAPRKILKQKVPTLSVLIADQTPFKTEIEYKTQFLNQLTPVFLGPEKIAKFSKQDVLYLNSERVKRGNYELELIPISKASEELEPYEITNRHVKVLENIIKAKPSDWLWSHRRWKYQNY